MPTYGQTFSFRDIKGQTSTVRMFIVGATPAAALADGIAIEAALAALSVASLGASKGAFTSSPAINTYGAAGAYDSVEDKAQLTYQTGTGAIHRYEIPAPLASIFLADDETVDPANGLVAALTAAMVGKASSRDGVLLGSYVGGIRTRTKMIRKFNIFTLNPQLTGPGE